MNIAIIETSTERAIAALFCKDELLGVVELPLGLVSSKYMIPEFETLLQTHGFEAKDLDAVVSGVGPGSYTGIRVGAVIAKTLSFACQVPLIGVCSLDGFVPESDGPFAAIIDAKMSGVYLKKGKKEGNQIFWESEPLVLPVDSAKEFLEGVDVLVTPHKAQIERKIQGDVEERAPNPEVLYQTAKKKLDQNAYTLDGTLELLYLRKTQAEIDVKKTSCDLFHVQSEKKIFPCTKKTAITIVHDL